MALKQSQRNIDKLKSLLPRSKSDDKLSSQSVRRSADLTPRSESRARSRDRKKRRETTGGIELQLAWNRPGASKHTRLTQRTSIPDDHFETNETLPKPQIRPVGIRQQPEGLSENENESEWDEMSVLETFARGQVLFDFDGSNIPDLKKEYFILRLRFVTTTGYNNIT